MNRTVLSLLATAALLGACGTATAGSASRVAAEGTAAPVASTAAPTVVTPAPGRAGSLVLPDMAGRSLHHAYEELVAAGMTKVDREDASGLGRTFVNDTIWSVCVQVPEPGAEIALTEVVTLYAVKVGEACPGA